MIQQKPRSTHLTHTTHFKSTITQNHLQACPQTLTVRFLSLLIYIFICSLLLYKFPDWCVPEPGHRSIAQNDYLGNEARGERGKARAKSKGNDHPKSPPSMRTNSDRTLP